jgi:hypothetical protein
MKFSENQFRDFLFTQHKESLSSLVVGSREPIKWTEDGFPPVRYLLQHSAEKRINAILDDLAALTLTAKELRLEKDGDSTTRIDLIGNYEGTGLAIIELKKSKQTERQAFTELLAYANHFCSIFPGMNETSITSILVAPMETRTVRDAYVQELVSNNKNVLALIPEEDFDGQIILSVYYPSESYYQWFENNLYDDRSMLTVAISFPIVDGWIDTDLNNDRKGIPDYSKDALNTISSAISHKLESLGWHSLTYASQKWGEIAQTLPYPNLIFVAAINPFASFKTLVADDEVYGESPQGRLDEIQSIYDQLHDNDKDYWIEFMESNFHDNLIKVVRNEFELCFINGEQEVIDKEVSLPDWYELKISMIDSVFTHNLDIYLTGMLREIYTEYLKYIYGVPPSSPYYTEGLEKYSYGMLRDYFTVCQNLSRLGFLDKDEDEDE